VRSHHALQAAHEQFSRQAQQLTRALGQRAAVCGVYHAAERDAECNACDERHAWRQTPYRSRQTPYRSAVAQCVRACERLEQKRLLVRQAAHGCERAQKSIFAARRGVVSGAVQQRRALFRRLHCSSVRKLHHASARAAARRAAWGC
jgi:hypothetical protein